MLRPALAVLAIAAAVFVLAPTVHSVHESVDELEIRRDMPWEIWKWGQHFDPPDSILPPQCDNQRKPLYSEVTDWPARIRKNETFSLGGIVTVGDANGTGVGDIVVDLFLNETKEEPGVYLGHATTDGAGRFRLEGTFPFELQATKYHLVAHALEKRIGCKLYLEHWSDPEMEVTSRTSIKWDPFPVAIKGRETTVSGLLLDSVGAPVREAKVVLAIDGKPRDLVTDGAGRFRVAFTPDRPGNHTMEAAFKGTEYYSPSQGAEKLLVREEFVEIDGANGPDGVELLRGAPAQISGTVYLSGNRTPGPINVTLAGVRLVACDGCPPTDRLTAQPDADGRFRVPVTAPSGETPGPFTLNVSGGGLKNAVGARGTLFVPVQVELSASAPTFERRFAGAARAVDEAGAPVPGDVALMTPQGWLPLGEANETGARAFAASSPCGVQRLMAQYNGTGYHRPASSQADVSVCPLLAYVPPFLLAIPWWGWVLLAVAAFATWIAVGWWRARFASTIRSGPPLTVTFTQPQDAAVGIVAPGEEAVATAFLEDALPEGHVLRMGTHRSAQPVEVGPDLRADLRVAPERLGELPVRAEIVDKRGRVVSRRTARLRVVRYAEEIEARHLALRRERLGDRAERASPREFEAWLAERHPTLDREVARRLVGVFEEADYGPRDAGRAELVAYLEAERGVEEVEPRAVSP